MLDYRLVKRDRRKFLALTGLTLKEFKALLPAFVEAYQEHYPPEKTVAGRKRQRQRGGGRPGRLATAEQQLLFILVHQKTYPLQVVLGEVFDEPIPSQSMGASTFANLERGLERVGVMPERDRRTLLKRAAHGEPRDFIIDGTERRRQRPKSLTNKRSPTGARRRRTVTRM